jgi:hypothetical protein
VHVELAEDPHINLNYFSQLPTWHIITDENIKQNINFLQEPLDKQIHESDYGGIGI